MCCNPHRRPPRLRVVQRHRPRRAARARTCWSQRPVGHADPDLDHHGRSWKQALGQAARCVVGCGPRRCDRALPSLAMAAEQTGYSGPYRGRRSQPFSPACLQHAPLFLERGIGALDRARDSSGRPTLGGCRPRHNSTLAPFGQTPLFLVGRTVGDQSGMVEQGCPTQLTGQGRGAPSGDSGAVAVVTDSSMRCGGQVDQRSQPSQGPQ